MSSTSWSWMWWILSFAKGSKQQNVGQNPETARTKACESWRYRAVREGILHWNFLIASSNHSHNFNRLVEQNCTNWPSPRRRRLLYHTCHSQRPFNPLIHKHTGFLNKTTTQHPIWLKKHHYFSKRPDVRGFFEQIDYAAVLLYEL